MYLLFFVLVIILLLVVLFAASSSEKYVGTPHSTYLTTVGHRPYLGDYLPYVGQVPTGEGGYELESAVGEPDGSGDLYLQEELCQECMNNCVNVAYIRGMNGGDLRKIKSVCKSRCETECNPNSGL